MLPSRRHLHALSRDPGVLTKAILIVLGSFFVSALWLGVHRKSVASTGSYSERRGERALSVLTENPVDRVKLLRAMRDDADQAARWREYARAAQGGIGEPDEGAGNMLELPWPELLAASPLPPAEAAAFIAWHRAMTARQAGPDLIAAMENLMMPSAPELPLTMASDLRRVARDYEGALAGYEKAGSAPGGGEARRRAVALALNRDWTGVLDRLMAQSAYQESVHGPGAGDGLSLMTARHQRDVRVLWRQSLAYSVSLLRQTDLLVLSLLTGTVWFISLHKACRLARRKWWWSLPAVFLGLVSTVLTLVLVDLQEARQGLTDSDLTGPALLYQIAGVGLREEIAKLVCLLPLLLLLLLCRGTPGQALMAASCAGLGFAVGENISYYAGGSGNSVISRFLTANFMHLAMTGLTGHALFRFLRWPKNFGPAFLATFCLMVLLHGFYNFSAGSRGAGAAGELATLFPFLIAGLAWHYFQVVREEQEDAPQTLSAQAVFWLGTAVIVGALLNWQVYRDGWGAALEGMVPAVLSSAVLCSLFSHFLRDAS